MSPNTKKRSGFTLIELLVAVAIIGIIGVISTQLLWDSVTTRSKQNSIETSSGNLRTFIKNLTNSVQEASFINVPNSSRIEIKGKVCRSIQFKDGKIEEAESAVADCTPPDALASYHSVTEEGITISSFELSPTALQPSTVTLTIIGNYIDSLGEHPIDFSTTITPRVTI